MGTRTAADALQCAHQFLETGKTVTITDPGGARYDVEEFRTHAAKADPDGLECKPAQS